MVTSIFSKRVESEEDNFNEEVKTYINEMNERPTVVFFKKENSTPIPEKPATLQPEREKVIIENTDIIVLNTVTNMLQQVRVDSTDYAGNIHYLPVVEDSVTRGLANEVIEATLKKMRAYAEEFNDPKNR